MNLEGYMRVAVEPADVRPGDLMACEAVDFFGQLRCLGLWKARRHVAPGIEESGYMVVGVEDDAGRVHLYHRNTYVIVWRVEA